jgi:hypothetical protein
LSTVARFGLAVAVEVVMVVGFHDGGSDDTGAGGGGIGGGGGGGLDSGGTCVVARRGLDICAAEESSSNEELVALRTWFLIGPSSIARHSAKVGRAFLKIRIGCCLLVG